MIENKEFLGIITERLESLKGVIGAGAIHGFNNIQGLIFNQIEIIKQTEKHDALHEENDGGTMKKHNALEYWGQLAIKLSKENREIREQIVGWIIQLDTPDFKDTDAEMTRDEMIRFLDLELMDDVNNVKEVVE